MYIAPLRHAVLHLGAAATPFTVQAVARLGSSTLGAARGYLSRLVWDGVLLDLPSERFIATSAYHAWSLERPKTKPGGHRIVPYCAVKEIEHAHSA
jgi:hypothetical protein